MHYRLQGLIIKTENAAKPVSQPSQHLLDWIATLPKNATVLDYGCGKFRYTIPLARRVRQVHSVDSKYQIDRTQIINGKKTNLLEYVKKYLPKVRVHYQDRSSWTNIQYDYVLCANVLSTIPHKKDRIAAVHRISNSIDHKCKVLLCTQFRNSYFKSYEQNPKAKKVLDGWLIESNHGPSFYGIIPPDKLKDLCTQGGLNVLECYQRGESAYVVASK